MKLLILGASGGCGRWLVRLARERGHEVRAIVRPATPYEAPAQVDVVRAEVLTPGVIDSALEDRDAVLSALGIRRRSPLNPWSALMSPPDLTARVAGALAQAMTAHDVERIVAISAAGVGDSFNRTTPILRWMIRNSNMAAPYADLENMESTLAASELDWTAVRPTTLTPGGPNATVRTVEHYGLRSRISRASVASWMLNAIESQGPTSARTPMIARESRRAARARHVHEPTGEGSAGS